MELEGKRIKLQIWDTAGQERFQTITASYYRGAMGIMLVYDVTSRKTFENITKWMHNIQTWASHDVEKIVIGNKADMTESREVSVEEGTEMAQQHGVQLFETSAKVGANVEQAFLELTKSILHKMPRDQEAPRTVAYRLSDDTNPRPNPQTCCSFG